MKHSKKILALGFFLLLPSCLSWFLEKPTFALKEVAVTRISSTKLNFLFGIEVQNPNNFDLKIRSLEYLVYFNDREVGKGRLEKGVEVPKASSTLVQVPLEADFKSLGSLLGVVLLNQNLQYKIEGVAIIKASLGTATIPFSKSGDIRLKN